MQFIYKVKNENRSFILGNDSKRINQLLKNFCIDKSIYITEKLFILLMIHYFDKIIIKLLK